MQRGGAAAAVALVEAENVSKRFILHLDSQRSFQESFIRLFQRRDDDEREFWPLRDISFTVMRGDCMGIIGPNGSGKSTLLKLIGGILEPTSGQITTHGRIASLLELGAGFHPELTGRENIFLNASLHGLDRSQVQERLDDIIEFAELGEFIDMPIKHYSSGMYVRLGFSVAIHTRPDLLIVDEVLAVGDISFQIKCLESIREFRQQGGTLLLVSHDLATVQSLCNRAMWIDDARVRAAGNPTDVVMAYLNDMAAKREQQSGAPSLPELEEGRRWGTGRVQITGVELCDGGGKPRSVFVNGAPLQVRLRYRAEQPVEDPVFGIAFHHQNGVHVSGPNSAFADLHIPVIHGDGEVVYSVAALPLTEGKYLISVASHNRADDEMYDYHDRAYPLLVYPGACRERYGLVTLGGEWGIAEPTVAGRGQ